MFAQYTRIQNAVRFKNYEKIDDMLRVGEDRRLLLEDALEWPDFEVFEYIAKKIGVDETYGKDERSILMNLMRQNKKIVTIQQLEMLLKYTKNINLTDVYGNTALDYYLNRFTPNSHLYIPILKLFMEHSANPFMINERDGNTINACFYKNYEVETLNCIIKNIKPDFINISLATLVCALEGHPDKNYDYIELLLPYVNNINEIDTNGHNILWYAQNTPCANKDEIIELLIANGACM